MKKLLFLTLPFLLSLNFGCATSGKTNIQQSQDVALKTTYALGVSFQATPKILEALLSSGTINGDSYDAAVPVYNQALASYKLLVKALDVAVLAGTDPEKDPNFLKEKGQFLLDKATIDNLIVAMGGQPQEVKP